MGSVEVSRMGGKQAVALREELETPAELLKQAPKTKHVTIDLEQAPQKKLPIEKIQALILEHQEHGRRLAWSFLTTWRIRMKQDEVVSVVGAALCEAAHRFDDTRGVSFKTFFFYHLRGMLLKEISRMISEQRLLQYIPQAHTGEYHSDPDAPYSVSASAMPVEQTNPEDLTERKEISRICWDACSKLDALEQEVIVRHFIYDEPLINIADELNYCRCHISRVKSRGLLKLKRLLGRSMDDESVEQPQTQTERLSPEARAALEGLRRSYTGGRGRRRRHTMNGKPIR